MFDTVINSVKDSFSQKIRNPFLGTLIFVWIFKNWRLVYGLFTFDEKTTQEVKIAYIEKYFNTVKFYSNLGECILKAFIVLISTYILLAVARYIVDIFDNLVFPWIKGKARGKVVEIDKYNDALNLVETHRVKQITERELRDKAERELQDLENTVSKLRSDNLDLNTIKSENQKLSARNLELQGLKTSYDNLGTRYDELLEISKHDKIKAENLASELKSKLSFESAYEELKVKFDILTKDYEKLAKEEPINLQAKKMLSLLRQSKVLDKFISLKKMIAGNIPLDINDHDFRLFVNLDLIFPNLEKIENISRNGSYPYQFSKLGLKVIELFEKYSNNATIKEF